MSGLEIGNRTLGAGAVIARPLEVIAEFRERKLDRAHEIARIARAQDPISDACRERLRGGRGAGPLNRGWLGWPRWLRQREGCRCAVRRLARGCNHRVDRLGGLRADLGIQLEAVFRLEVGDRRLGIGAVIAGPAQTISEACERALNRPDIAAPIAEPQNPIGDDRGDALLGDVLIRMRRNRLRREIAGPRRELDVIYARLERLPAEMSLVGTLRRRPSP